MEQEATDIAGNLSAATVLAETFTECEHPVFQWLVGRTIRNVEVRRGYGTKHGWIDLVLTFNDGAVAELNGDGCECDGIKARFIGY